MDKASLVKSKLLDLGVMTETEAEAHIERMVAENRVEDDRSLSGVSLGMFNNLVKSLRDAVVAPDKTFFGAPATPDTEAKDVETLAKSMAAVGARVDRLADASITSANGLNTAFAAVGDIMVELVKSLAALTDHVKGLKIEAPAAAPAAEVPMAKSQVTAPAVDPRTDPMADASADDLDPLKVQSVIEGELLALRKSMREATETGASVKRADVDRARELQIAIASLTTIGAKAVVDHFNIKLGA